MMYKNPELFEAGLSLLKNSFSQRSAVLRAMGVPVEFGVGTLRLSTGRHTTDEDVRAAAALIIAEAKRQMAES